MVYRLADGVQVRKESWGLLFYSSSKHKLRFVKSGDLLHPRYFDGTWTAERMIEDAAGIKGSNNRALGPSILKLIKYLVDSELIVNEPR